LIVKDGNRKRYIGFFISEKDIRKKELIEEIKNKSLLLFGKDARSKGFFLLKIEDNYGILRCKHTEKENAIKMLNSIDKIGFEKVKINTIGTSGTIKSLIKKHFDKK